ncbi:MAG TPA: class I SAM-dependent DNA methyltransferase [Candidatus Syntrophosphaera sp.]|nr:class I SAM-dependent DNA methyltransferase [Candidatus Syntrophosphaera sp.]HQK28659.1 class I SAM-dependent DNA methyltransferase [Candidatus Syntrophosphaera sp.]HRQ68307.1 class I SAM-dependent DNA methyltransferase [Candidatus Syntrophosphaera sp.]
MATQSHSQIASFIWSICNLLRGPYKRNEYRKVILPFTVLRRFDCILAPTKERVLAKLPHLYGKSDNIISESLIRITGVPFFNKSKLDMKKLLDDTDNIAINLQSYINDFSPNVQKIIEYFAFSEQIARLQDANLLYMVLQRFVTDELDLSPQAVDNIQMGLAFEELIRIGAEQSNEEAGEHFTPREVIKLMVNLLLSPESDLAKSHVVKTIFDPACGTGGMLTAAETYIKELNRDAKPHMFGQDWNKDSYAVCCSDMLIKGENAVIRHGCSFEQDGFTSHKFDYMLANPPFGVEWKKQQKSITDEHEKLGFKGRFGAGLPRINDGSLLFLQHMISKMRSVDNGGSRIGIVFNGSPLFTGDAGSGESNIRKWIIENDWLEAIVAMPDQLFYNTGISTYIWIITNRKEAHRQGKIQLIDARQFYHKMRKSLGNKRNIIGDGEDKRFDHISLITRIHADFIHNQELEFESNGETIAAVVSKIFDNEDFGYHKITVERPLRLNFQATAERIARLDGIKAFARLAESKKKDPVEKLQEIEAGKSLQEKIKTALKSMDGSIIYKNRKEFNKSLKQALSQNNLDLAAPELKAIIEALSERDETADVCTDAKGRPEPDTELRDTENVSLKEEIETYFKREVLPHVPDAWIDHSKTKTGYEIPLNRHFYVYQPPRPLEEIEAEMKALENEIAKLLEET